MLISKTTTLLALLPYLLVQPADSALDASFCRIIVLMRKDLKWKRDVN